VQLLLAPLAGIDRLVIFGTATAIAALIVFIVLRSARTAEERSSGFTRLMTGGKAKIGFTLLALFWAVGFGLVLQLVPHEGANSPYGGLGLIAMFSGLFIMMGFLWAVIGE
jgi:hypothetical protein